MKGRKIQLKSAPAKTAMTRFSWVGSPPSLSSSERMISRPPGISWASERKTILVRTTQLMASMTAAKETPSSIEAASFGVALECSRELIRARMAPPMGTMMTAVAVVETHMVISALGSMRPKTIWLGLVPTARMISRATRRCRFQRCVARPSTMPPRTR